MRRRRSILLLLWLVCFCSLHASCGYHFTGGTVDSSPVDGKRLAVPIFANRSYRPNLETILTDKVKHELSFRTGGKVVPVSEADVILSGTVTAYAVKPVSYDHADRITRYNSELAAEMVLHDRSGNILWKGQLSEKQEFSADADISVQLNRENAAVQDICRRLAQRLNVAIRENF